MDTNLAIRPNFLDWAKFIGIFIVIFGHYVWYLNIPLADDLLWNNARNVTLFHMPLFFIISGMLHKRNESFRNALKRNIKQLLLPYLLINLICMSVLLLRNCVSGGSALELSKYVLKCLWGIFTGADFGKYSGILPSGPLWFLYSLFCIKSAFDIFCIIVLKHRYIVGLCMVLLVLLGVILIFIKGNILPFRIDSSIIGVIFFAIGFYLRVYFIKILNFNLLFVFLISFLITFFCGYMNISYTEFQTGHLSVNACIFGHYPYLFFVSGISGTIGIFAISKILEQFRLKIVSRISSGTIIALGFSSVDIFIP
jgi:fucose 4-O-acetylase-like acetyltransferase